MTTPTYLAELAREHTTGELFRAALAAGVPIAMQDLEQQGGPLERDYEAARAFGETIATEGADILFRSKKRGVTAKLMTQLIRTLAVLAYAPGGVSVAGLLFDTGSRTPRGRSVAGRWAGAKDSTEGNSHRHGGHLVDHRDTRGEQPNPQR